MGFKILPFTVSDLPAFGPLDDAAMRDWPVAAAMQNCMPAGQTRAEVMMERTRESLLRNDEENKWLKLVDTDLDDEMIAVAKWDFKLEGPSSKKSEEAPPPQKTAEAEAEAAEGVQATPEGMGLDQPPPKSSVMFEMGRSMNAFLARHVGGKPHITLNILVTSPAHQRRGAGSMLLRWGLEQADEHGVVTVLAASSAGLGLYAKHGFHVVMEDELDLRPYGVEMTEVRRYMVREPVAKGSNGGIRG